MTKKRLSDAEKIAERKAFFEAFKKAFDTKTLSAVEHKKNDEQCTYTLVHIFENEVKTQRCYYQRKSTSAFYFVLNKHEAEMFISLDEASEHEIVTKTCRVPLDTEKELKQLAIYVDASASVNEIAKFAKRLCAIAQMTANTEQTKQSEAKKSDKKQSKAKKQTAKKQTAKKEK